MPGQDYCTMRMDANPAGVGGIQKPRKVLVAVSTDVHDQNKQLSRLVCTYQSKGTVICRDWDKLGGDQDAPFVPRMPTGKKSKAAKAGVIRNPCGQCRRLSLRKGLDPA
jgi:hypothetical protein